LRTPLDVHRERWPAISLVTAESKNSELRACAGRCPITHTRRQISHSLQERKGKRLSLLIALGEIYEGPLDLLLDLIRKQDIDIYDIPIAKITAQYLVTSNAYGSWM